MAREAKITQGQVDAAADALRAAGINPTVRAVREKLGSVGGNVTVGRLLNIWKGKQVRAPEAPPTLPAGLQRVMLDLQRAMLECVGQVQAEARAEPEAQLVELRQQYDDVAAENDRQALDLEAMRESLETALRERDAAAGRAVLLEEELAQARAATETERIAAEVARTELAKAQLRLEAMPRLEADVAGARADLERERAARLAELEAERGKRAAAEQAAAVAVARLEGESRARERAEAELAASTARADQAAAQLAEERLSRARTERLHAARPVRKALNVTPAVRAEKPDQG